VSFEITTSVQFPGITTVQFVVFRVVQLVVFRVVPRPGIRRARHLCAFRGTVR